MRALHVHHDANSLPGLVGTALDELGVAAGVHQVGDTAGSPVGSPDFPDPEGFDLIVLYGSRWSVYEDRVAHWVEPELEFIRSADRARVPVLGLCFGGQILAAALGGSVAPLPEPEIGWLPVRSDDPSIEAGPWLEWHFDGFTVPDAAVELARTDASPQAFRLRRNLGLQFHPEADRAVLESWMEDDLDQLVAAGLDAERLLADADHHRDDALDRARRLVTRFLRNENVF